MLKKVLIANRGEIAVRVIRACRDMGIGSVAVYSEEDRMSLPVQLADERVCIGAGPARDSYLKPDRIISAAILAAKTVGYTNAGTIEFIVDQEGSFYFMEMNTRIQVEHGVTELLTDTDLVAEQLRVASGLELSFTQEDVKLRGHAIECRINAEIPEKNFMPSPGKITVLHLPGGNGVRVDTALYTGYIVPSNYDSMIAKILVYAPTREAAIRKMRAALNETLIIGVETNLDFQFRIMQNKVFCEGKADTGFIEKFVGGGR